jgi:hypothetical protein
LAAQVVHIHFSDLDLPVGRFEPTPEAGFLKLQVVVHNRRVITRRHRHGGLSCRSIVINDRSSLRPLSEARKPTVPSQRENRDSPGPGGKHERAKAQSRQIAKALR